MSVFIPVAEISPGNPPVAAGNQGIEPIFQFAGRAFGIAAFRAFAGLGFTFPGCGVGPLQDEVFASIVDDVDCDFLVRHQVPFYFGRIVDFFLSDSIFGLS